MSASQKLFTGDPNEVTVTRKVTENITTYSVPFARFGRIKFGGRQTVVRLASGALAVFSPIGLTPAMKESISATGTPKYIVAPDFEHHINLGPWHQAYPDAKIISPEGLPEKRAKQGDEKVRFDVVFTAKSKETQRIDDEFDAEFDYEYVPSHGNKELVFNYKRDRTLIEADLIFNLPAVEQYSKSKESPHTGILTKFFGSFTGTTGPTQVLRQRRFIWYMLSSANRAGFNQSMSAIDKWDFDRIIPCHGDVIESGGKSVFRNVMQWHLRDAQGK